MTSDFQGIYLGPDDLHFKPGNHYQITVTLVPATGEVVVSMREETMLRYRGLREFVTCWETSQEGGSPAT